MSNDNKDNKQIDRQNIILNAQQIKAFMKIYRLGNGISNQQLKKVIPDLYPGDLDD